MGMQPWSRLGPDQRPNPYAAPRQQDPQFGDRGKNDLPSSRQSYGVTAAGLAASFSHSRFTPVTIRKGEAMKIDE